MNVAFTDWAGKLLGECLLCADPWGHVVDKAAATLADQAFSPAKVFWVR